MLSWTLIAGVVVNTALAPGDVESSLALILPTIVGPLSQGRGHAFRSAPETRALRSTDI